MTKKNLNETNFLDKTVFGITFKTILIALAIWTILGLSFASESYLRNYKAGRILPAWIFVIEFLTEFYLYALFSLIVFKIGNKFPLEFKGFNQKLFATISIHLFASVIFSMVNVFMGAFIAWLWQRNMFPTYFTINMILDPHFLHRGIIVYWGILIVGKGIENYREMQNEKVRVAELSSQLSAAQLSALKMQIHPHFLFNTLNSIAALVEEDKESAEIMITKLSDFLRMTLKSSAEPIVTLKQEFHFLKTYLEIEEVRFQERLTTEFIYQEEILSAKIPNLILQPLVENSIKHGISNKKQNGYIKIIAAKDQNQLKIEIVDNGKMIEENKANFSKSGGVGLENTVSRLKEIYQDNYLFEIKGNQDNGTTVIIEIPFNL